MLENAIETMNLSCGYGSSLVIDKISVKVKKGKITVLIGPNGSGKSTLLKGILGIARKFGGKVLFEGKDITSETLERIVKMGISYIPQTDNVFTELTIQENLEMGAYLQKSWETVKSKINEVFEIFPELKPFKNRKAGTLSGGERQMLAIARGLMTNPSLVILDEPTQNLAPKAIAVVHEKIREINKTGVTIFMAEQNAKAALKNADNAYVLSSGKCVYKNKAREVLKEDLKKLFFPIEEEKR